MNRVIKIACFSAIWLATYTPFQTIKRETSPADTKTVQQLVVFLPMKAPHGFAQK